MITYFDSEIWGYFRGILSSENVHACLLISKPEINQKTIRH